MLSLGLGRHNKLLTRFSKVGEAIGVSEQDRKAKYPSLEVMPTLFIVVETQDILEKHYNDMQDMEFTIQEGKFWMLQTRNGKRTQQLW
jgi:pyruvate,orthophosphate dikinase